MDKIKTAVVGLNMGLQHAYAYHLSERAELKWVVDLDEEKAAKVADELDCRYTTDWASIIDDVDAVSICTPHHLHAPQSLQAIEAGKHVLLEKPLANSEEDCLQVIRAAQARQVTLMLAYIVRFRPAVIRLKKAIETQEFGQPFNMDGWVQAYLTPRPDTWFAKKETLGGGVLFSHGCHYIDIMIWLLGKPVRVSALGTRLGTSWLEGEGTSHATIAFENGALAHLASSWGMKYKDSPAKFHVHTPEAVLILNNGISKLEVITEDGRRTLHEDDPQQRSVPGRNALGQVDHFLECIMTGQRPSTDGHEILKSHRVIWAMYEQNGVPVQV